MFTASTGTASTPFRYAGQYTDEGGLIYLRARYYDSSTEQYLSVDPLASLTQQPYSYAADNPMNWVDPSGLCWADSVWVPIGGSGSCSDAAGATTYNALPVVHKAAVGATIAASGCAIAPSWTAIGGGACAAVAAGAAGVGAVSGVALWVRGRQSGSATAVDAAGVVLGGGSYLGEVGARSAEGAAEAASEASNARISQLATARWYAKGGLWLSGHWWAFKSGVWNLAASLLTATAMALDLSGTGAGVYGLVCE